MIDELSISAFYIKQKRNKNQTSYQQISCNPLLQQVDLARAHDPTETLSMVSGQFQKTRDLDELKNWVRNMVMWYWSADTLFWQESVDHKRDVQYKRSTR